MSGRHVQSLGRRVGLRWLVGAGALLMAAATAFAIAPNASATAQTVHSQLSLSGLASADNPVGGSVIGIHPGDTVSLKAAGAPTAGLEKLGLGGLVDGVLNLLVKFQVKADFSNLPNGKAGTVLSGSTAKSFTFPKAGTYNFTWTAQKVELLGVVPINLDGNQLAAAGVKLNGSNQYVGKIVVAANPPKGGISIQLPAVHVAPSAPGVGQLSSVGVPGVVAPTLHVPSVGNLLPSKTNGTKPAGGTSGGAANPTTGVKLPGLSIPDQVMPKDSGGFGNGGGGGFYLGDVPNSGSQLTNIAPGGTGSGKSSTGAKLNTQDSSGKNKSIDLASSKASPSGQLPVVLAILAIIALALVAGTYARLFLLRRSS